MARARLVRVGSRSGRRLGWRSMVAGPALALSAAVSVAVAGAAVAPLAHASASAKAATSSGSACGKATGPFSVSGTRVLGAGGKPFISYGLTVPGLQSPAWAGAVSLDLEEITAAADNWCANTVRLQLNQDDLLGPDGTSLDQAYLTAIESEVSLAKSYNLVVVLNDETNLATPAEQAVQRGPTPATETFWKDLGKIYGHDPQVIFDLFNEPRMYSTGMSQAQEWQLWLDGGTYDGVYYPFGMGQLAAYVRNTVGARNLFWIEGPNFSASFAGMIQQHALLNVSGVVYAVHHPAGPADQDSWDDDFGYLISGGVAPVVDGEWTNYEPAPTSYPTPVPSSCWPDAPTSVPEFLNYLAQHGIGLNAYTLQPGFLIQSYSNLAEPTTMNASTWTCRSNTEPDPGQGAGSAVQAWFRQQNS
jgi:Cellulase (glycosyl hydrolase family 5)